MTLELIPMLLLSLLLLASDGADAGVARLVLSGDHRLDATDEAVIVGDATVTVPADTEIPAPSTSSAAPPASTEPSTHGSRRSPEP